MNPEEDWAKGLEVTGSSGVFLIIEMARHVGDSNMRLLITTVSALTLISSPSACKLSAFYLQLGKELQDVPMVKCNTF